MVVAGKIIEGPMSGREQQHRLRWLVFHAWNIPPLFGLGFILLIGVLQPAHIIGILTTPLEPAYILGWLAFSLWFLPRQMRPLADWLDGKPGCSPESAQRAVRRFPLVFWGTFLIYLAIAPASVILAAEIYTDFVATPYDWFRIELVALIVSIIVGPPIFFLIFAHSFGQSLGPLKELTGVAQPLPETRITALRARSTDEIGVITADYRTLLEEQRLHWEILELNNRLLRSAGGDFGTAAVFQQVVELCRQAVNAEQAFVLLFDPAANELRRSWTKTACSQLTAWAARPEMAHLTAETAAAGSVED